MRHKIITYLIFILPILIFTSCLSPEESGTIKSIVLVGKTETKDVLINFNNPFSSDVTSYVSNVDYLVEQINITAEAASGSIVEQEDIGLKNLIVGENHFQVRVRNEESGLLKTYYFYIVREEANADSYLNSLDVSGIIIEPSFDKKLKTYQATVPFEISKTTVSAIKNNDKAIINDEDIGEKELVVGKNVLEVRVTAQDGNIRTYTAIITREVGTGLESNTALKSLFLGDNIGLEPSFLPSITTYQSTVSFDTSLLTISAEAYSTKSKIVSGTGEKKLTVGTNMFTIIIEAEDGSRNSYILIITREDSDSADGNNYLSSLIIEGVAISPSFSKENTLYEAEVPYETESITINAVAEKETAVLSPTIPFIKDLKVGVNIVEIITKAENNSDKTYVIAVSRRSSGTNSGNSKLVSLELSDIILSPNYSPENQTYIAIVPFDVISTTVSAITVDSTSNITNGNIGKKDLVVGTNRLEVEVKAEDGNTTIYSILVIRESGEVTESNTNLKSLDFVIENDTSVIAPTFSPDVLLYQINVSNLTSVAKISAEAQNSESVVSGETGNVTLKEGINTFTINIKAPSGVEKSYIIVVKRESSGDNLLNSLSMKSNKIEKLLDFSPVKTSYHIEIPYEEQVVFISAETSSSKATMTDDSDQGEKNLKVGDNLFRVTIKAENGSVKVYIIIVTRKALDNDATLTSLSADSFILNPTFSSDTYSYIVGLKNEVSSLTIQALVNSEKASITGIGTLSLDEGVNIKKIEVTAEDGTKKVYTLVINRDYKYSEASLISMDLSAGTLYPEFSETQQTYTAIVSNYTTEFSINTIKSSETISVTKESKYNLVAGTNIIEILANAEDNTKKIM